LSTQDTNYGNGRNQEADEPDEDRRRGLEQDAEDRGRRGGEPGPARDVSEVHQAHEQVPRARGDSRHQRRRPRDHRGEPAALEAEALERARSAGESELAMIQMGTILQVADNTGAKK